MKLFNYLQSDMDFSNKLFNYIEDSLELNAFIRHFFDTKAKEKIFAYNYSNILDMLNNNKDFTLESFNNIEILKNINFLMDCSSIGYKKENIHFFEKIIHYI